MAVKATFTGRFPLSQITLRPAPEFYILPQFSLIAAAARHACYISITISRTHSPSSPSTHSCGNVGQLAYFGNFQREYPGLRDINIGKTFPAG